MIMLFAILLLIIGAIVVYISQFNFTPVSVNLGFYVFSNVPLFYVIVASLLLGLVLSYLVYLVRAISTSFTLRGKDNEIKKEKAQILDLKNRIRQLETENEKLKKTPSLQSEDNRTTS